MWINQVAINRLCHHLFEWLKFIELLIAMGLGSVENKLCFSTLSFLNYNKLKNKLTSNIDRVMHMYCTNFLYNGNISLCCNRDPKSFL
jgi:hypothetical protein